MRLWLRRMLQIHAVAALALAPMLVIPELLGTPPVARLDGIEDPSTYGVFGLFVTAWTASWHFLHPAEGLLQNLTIVYLSQFAVFVLLVRDGYRHLTGRAARCGPRAILSLGLLAMGGLALFVVMDSVAVAAFGSGPLSLLLVIAATVGELYVAGACWLALPAVAVDGRSLLSGMGRSFLLSQGSRFQISAVIALLAVLQLVLMIPIGILSDAFHTGSRLAWVLLVPAFLGLPLKACVLAAAYQEACYRKEGAGVEDVSRVFA
jgi:hypothetical protein